MWKSFSRKRCIIFLCFYTFCIVILSFYLKMNFVYKHVNCTTQNSDNLNKENKLILSIDAYLEKLISFSNFVDNMSISHEWFQATTNIYVYSAFLEMCPSHLSQSSQFCVKFISVMFNSTYVSPFLKNVKCAVKNYFKIFKEKSAAVEILPENHFKLFSAAFIFCPVKNSYISHAAVYGNNSLNLTWIAVENQNLQPNISLSKFSGNVVNSQYLQSPSGINLCIRPLFNDFVIVRFIEFLTYYSVMGIDHFMFYYPKSFKPWRTFLKTLAFSNVSNEVHFWNMPLGDDLIHENGQIAFIQDCLARSKNKFKHSVIVDLDEYIVPKVHRDLKSLVTYLDETNMHAGSYVISSALFCNEYPVRSPYILPFHILNFNKRQKTPWIHKYRSKYIVKPERVRYSGVHFTWELENGFKEVFISPDIALINHYRHCCGVTQTWFFHLFEFDVLSDKIISDNTLLNRKDKLMNNTLFKFIVNVPIKNIL